MTGEPITRRMKCGRGLMPRASRVSPHGPSSRRSFSGKTMDDSVMVANTLKGRGSVSLDAACFRGCSPVTRTHGPGRPGVAGPVPFHLSPRAELLPPTPSTSSCWLGGPGSQGSNASTRGHGDGPPELEGEAATWPWGLRRPRSQQAGERVPPIAE